MTKLKGIYKLLDTFLDKVPKEDRVFFFKGTDVNMLNIMTIARLFPKFDVSKEDLILLYSPKRSLDTAILAISTKGIHHNSVMMPLSAELSLNEVPGRHVDILKSFLDEFELFERDSKRDLTSFANKFKAFVNEKEELENDYNIDNDFLQILKGEGEKLQFLAEDLNTNKSFNNALNVILKSGAEAKEFSAEHVILHDIIKVFNMTYELNDSNNKVADDKIKFLLAFLFEKLQGNDMIQSLSLKRINQLVDSEKFDSNIEIIKNASLFNLGEDYKNEFLLPSILKRIDDSHFTDGTTFIYRIASLIAKADGNVTDQETKRLTFINDKISNPTKRLEGVKVVEADEDETLDDVLAELNELIGLESIKKAIADLTNFLKIQKIRKGKGMKSVNNSLHSVFLGPPGTGKTTVARMISRVYRHLDYLDKGHLVETDRSGMVAGYVGQTALKVDQLVKEAMGGVLFIDEAYGLSAGDKRDFGNEAVEVLLKKMEDYREDLVVIVAGYPDEMKEFIESNPGLQSRFNRYYSFDHYKPKELLSIFELLCRKNDFVLTEDAYDKLEHIFDKLYEKRNKSFGNGRVVRNLFEKIIEYQANRLVKVAELTEEILSKIEESDVPPVNKTIQEFTVFHDDKASE